MAQVDAAFDALRDQFVRAFMRAYTIPPEMRAAVRRAIEKYQTRPLSEETLTRLVEEPQSPLTTVRNLANEEREHRQWGGLVDEWITAWEYNTTKKAPNVVLTIVNPDSRSKADLLYIVRSRSGRHFKCIPGPDCKSGKPRYLIQSFAKCAQRGITMVDTSGVLLNPQKLTATERKNFEAVCAQFPGRRPVPSSFTGEQRRRLKEDILHYLRTDKLPSELPKEKRPPQPRTGREFAPLAATLKEKAAALRIAAPVVDWPQFTKVVRPVHPAEATPCASDATKLDGVEPDHVAAPKIGAPVGIPTPSPVPGAPFPSWAKTLLLWGIEAGAAYAAKRLLSRFGFEIEPVGKAPSAPPLANANLADEIERSSPLRHTVGRHLQRYLTRNGPEWREKADYWRGGSK